MSSGNVAEISSPLDAPVLAKARADAANKRRRLDSVLRERIKEYDSVDTSLVVFGSLARGEWTSGSDLDWTYLSPLQILAKFLPQYFVPTNVQNDLFSSYSDFLTMLDDKDVRSALERLRATESRTDAAFKRVKEISAVFERSLDCIFFENELIKRLTRKYGVF